MTTLSPESTRDTFLRRSTTSTLMVDSDKAGAAADFVVTDQGAFGNTAVTASTQLAVTSSTNTQMRLAYDGSNYTTLTTNSSGNLVITPTGSQVLIVSDLAVAGGDILGTAGEVRLTLDDANDRTIVNQSLRTAFDGSNYVDFLTSSGGDLTVQPSGQDITFTSANTMTFDTNFADFAGDVLIEADTILGTLSIHDIAINAGTVTLSSNLNFDSNTFYIDQANNRIGTGSTAPEGLMDIHGTRNPLSGLGVMTNYHLAIRKTGNTNGAAAGIGFVDSSTANDVGASIYYTRVGANGYGNLSFATKNVGGTIAERMLISNTGAVGIGTSGPDAQLDVLSTSTQLRLTHTDGTQYTEFTVNGSGDLTIDPNGGDVTFDSHVNLNTGGQYRINSTSVLTSTTLGSGVTTSSLTSVGALASGSIASGFGTIATANTITGTTLNGTTGINTGASAGTQRINSSGDHLNARTITNNSSAPATSDLGLFQNSSTSWIRLVTNNGIFRFFSNYSEGAASLPTSNSEILTIDTNGQLEGETGSNTTPTYTFEGDDNTGIYRSAADTLAITAGGTQTARFTASTVAFPTVTTGANNRSVCASTLSSQIFFVDAPCTTSSQRFKENINVLSYGLDEVMQLRPVFFHYKPEFDTNTSRKVGFIAEEVAEIIPEVAAYDNDGQMLTIDYPKLTAVNTSAIQQLNRKVDTQFADISQNLNLNNDGEIELAANQRFTVKNTSNQQVVASIDANGTAEFKKVIAQEMDSRFITAESLQITGDASVAGTLTTQDLVAESARLNDLQSLGASVSGTLYANRLVGAISAESVEGLEERVRQLVEAQQPSQPEDAPESSPPDEEIPESTPEELNAFNGDVTVEGTLTATNLVAENTLLVDGTALTGRSFTFAIRDESSCGTDPNCNTFQFQPDGEGTLDFLAGLVVMSRDGGVIVNGDFKVTGNFTAESDVNIKTLRVNSASANPSDDNRSNSGQVDASSGTSVLLSGETSMTIHSNKVTPNSLIYITPTSSTQNRVLYIKEQHGDDQNTGENDARFTVGIDESAEGDIRFNWWIVQATAQAE